MESSKKKISMSLDISLLKQPKAFWVLAFGEMWNTFSYFGTQTILVLYVMHAFQLSREDSYTLYGTYAAFAYSLSILGGVIADRWLGYKNTVIIGSILSIFGNFLLLSGQYYFVCLGLAVSLVGFGLYKTNVTQLVGMLYPSGSVQKESGFTLFYLAINVGGVLGPVVYGLLVYAIGWRGGFLCSALSLLIAMIWFVRHQKTWVQLENPPQPARPVVVDPEERSRILLEYDATDPFKPKSYKEYVENLKRQSQVGQQASKNNNIHAIIRQELSLPQKFVLLGALSMTCLVLSLAFFKLQIANWFIVALFVAGVAYILLAMIKHQGKNRHRLFALFLLCFFGMFYFAVGLQIGATITLFIQNMIKQGILNTQLPANVFSAFYPLCVLLLAPVFTYVWRRLRAKGIVVDVPVKLAVSIILAMLGICVFAVASLNNFVLIGIIIGNLLLGAGELALTPAMYMAINDLSPMGMKGTMMGCLLLFVAFGGYLSSLLANVSQYVGDRIFGYEEAYFGQFLFIAVITFIVLLVFCLFVPRLTEMMN